MTSMQEALTEALEHPITEPRVRPTSARRKSQKMSSRSDASDSLMLAALGSLAGCLIVYGALKLRREHCG